MTSDKLISVEDAAAVLRVRPTYVRELVKKGRLSFADGGLLVTEDVDKLAVLMDKLRSDGIATLVNITAKNAVKRPENT